VCYGALDVPADTTATRLAAQALALELPKNAEIWVSPLQRCELLAQVLCGLRPDFACKIDARLAEMNFGEWEGVHWDNIPRAALDAWTADFGNHRFGGAESANAVLARVAAAWRDVQARKHPGDVVWITHAGVIRAATLLAQGVFEVQKASQWPSNALGFGQWSRL
jgi:alpha-ribazole phosphatase